MAESALASSKEAGEPAACPAVASAEPPAVAASDAAAAAAWAWAWAFRGGLLAGGLGVVGVVHGVLRLGHAVPGFLDALGGLLHRLVQLVVDHGEQRLPLRHRVAFGHEHLAHDAVHLGCGAHRRDGLQVAGRRNRLGERALLHESGLRGPVLQRLGRLVGRAPRERAACYGEHRHRRYGADDYLLALLLLAARLQIVERLHVGKRLGIDQVRGAQRVGGAGNVGMRGAGERGGGAGGRLRAGCRRGRRGGRRHRGHSGRRGDDARGGVLACRGADGTRGHRRRSPAAPGCALVRAIPPPIASQCHLEPPE